MPHRAAVVDLKDNLVTATSLQMVVMTLIFTINYQHRIAKRVVMGLYEQAVM